MKDLSITYLHNFSIRYLSEVFSTCSSPPRKSIILTRPSRCVVAAEYSLRIYSWFTRNMTRTRLAFDKASLPCNLLLMIVKASDKWWNGTDEGLPVSTKYSIHDRMRCRLHIFATICQEKNQSIALWIVHILSLSVERSLSHISFASCSDRPRYAGYSLSTTQVKTNSLVQ